MWLLLPILFLVSRVYWLVQVYGPTNRLLSWLRQRRNLRWGVPAMVLGLLYAWGASTCTVVIDNGGPEWLYFPVALLIWNALKLLIWGPWSLVLLASARLRERPHRPRRATDGLTHGPEQERAR